MTNEMHEKMLERVRALLAKAEATTFPEEAKAFSAKAQELMTRYAIDQAMLDAASGRKADMGQVRVNIGTAYTRATFTLFAAVAAANDCMILVDGDKRKVVWIAGTVTDMEATEMLYTSLRLQLSSEMLRMPQPSHVSTTTFRNSFIYGYAAEINNRLRRAKAEAQVDAQESYGPQGNNSVALVLANKKSEVERWLIDNKLMAPPESQKQSNLNKPNIDGSGYRSGREAASRADMGGRRMGAGTRPAGALAR